MFKKIVFISFNTLILLLAGCVKNNNTDESQEYHLHPLPSTAKILFVSNMDTGNRRKEIYAMDEEGNNITRITYSNFHHRIIGIDKTKRYIIVTRIEKDTDPPSGLGDEDKKTIWILDLTTGNERRLTNPQNNAEGDSFSPDGQWIVFHMTVFGENQADIYKIKIDGTKLTQLTHTYDATESDPAWSNDGQRIAFVTYDAQTERFVLKTMNNDGGNIKTVYDSADTVSTPYFKPGVYDPSWSPDDQWIVFEKPVYYSGENGDAGIWHIFKIHPDGSELTDLSENGGHDDMAEYYPAYSKNGEKIVFSARYGTSTSVNIDIFTMDGNGTSIKKITNTASYNDFGIWIK